MRLLLETHPFGVRAYHLFLLGLFCVCRQVLYIHIQVQDTVYELMDFKQTSTQRNTTYNFLSK